LEAARGELIRNAPADALALLDEIWDGAQHTEQGWYLRGGAHAVLGLPGEAARVAQEGLALRSASPALSFLLSLARLSLGDVVGARQALTAALEQPPDEPLLLAQQAVLLARSGDVAGAQRVMQRATALHPEHPAVLYARTH